MSEINIQDMRDPNTAATPPPDVAQRGPPSDTSDDRSDDERKKDAELAERLSRLIEDANSRVVPLCKMIRKHIENMEARKDEDRDEGELVQQVKPLLQQAEKILNETMGMIKGADPDNRLSDRAKRHAQTHNATPEEQRLAEALKVVRLPYLHLQNLDIRLRVRKQLRALPSSESTQSILLSVLSALGSAGICSRCLAEYPGFADVALRSM
ncbi:hypothetical protein C8J55DRAFT_138816 [Lentinula edodes]|uniref:DUF6987 domain-containing protein n=1 Tax=Lentinula lateritia TaxID=40482 RepID=A0A9W9A5P6_9AGAR|nr:hypothetical protein C8J55DRAFT_138816 [Lentinula edodes]